MYILVEGEKGRYDRDITMSVLCSGNDLEIVSADLLQRAMDNLKNQCDEEYADKAIHSIINAEKTCIKTDEYTSVTARYDKYGNIIYYSIGCPSDNEYMGFTYQILKI